MTKTALIFGAGSTVDGVQISKPDEIHPLASQSFVDTSFEQHIDIGVITGLGLSCKKYEHLHRKLECIKRGEL